MTSLDLFNRTLNELRLFFHKYGKLSDANAKLDEMAKYPGIVCSPGDLLFSKINPRIPRAILVPQFDFHLTCSIEFEIIQSTSE